MELPNFEHMSSLSASHVYVCDVRFLLNGNVDLHLF